MPLSEAQKAFRRTGIFASDVPMLTGHSSFGGPFDVFNAKTLGMDFEGNFATEIGDLLEDDTLELYFRRTGATLSFPGSVKHPEMDWLGATPDAIANGETVVQCKTCNPWAREEFGAPGSDEIPPGYLVQVQFEMFVLGKKACDVPVLFGTQDFIIYRVHFDAEFAQSLVTIATAFWRGNVLTKRPPLIDESKACGAYLANQFPANREPLKYAEQHHKEWAHRIRELKAEIAQRKKEADRLSNEMRESIANAEGLEGDGWRATWRANKHGKRSFRLKFQNEESADE